MPKKVHETGVIDRLAGRFYVGFKKLTKKQNFKKWYMVFSVTLLASSTVAWSMMGARINQNNSDQIVNPYMFESRITFTHALFPGQHSYLIKWPLFFMIHLFGQTARSYELATIALSLVTVLLLAVLLYWIERRPLVFGTLVMALSLAFFLIPAQPYPGGILPVGMAMITTRNVEYVLYMACLVSIIKARRIKSRLFLWAILGLTVLIASDKLFLTISLGGALMAFLCYALVKRWQYVTLTVRWLVATLAASLLGLSLLAVINTGRITHISQQSGGPFSLVHSVHGIMLGLFYALTGLLANFGAQPGFDSTYAVSMVRNGIRHLTSSGGPAILINFLVFAAALMFSYRIFRISIVKYKIRQSIRQDDPYRLSILMLWTTIASAAAFIFTDHYYAADARYLTISLFAGFISLAVYARTKRWADRTVVLCGLIISVALLASIPMVNKSYHNQMSAYSEMNKRNLLISQAVSSHPINTLVGDYWRVIPIKQELRGALAVTPLTGCSQQRDVLSSLNWRPELHDTSFAYILTLDKSLTDFPSCNLNDAMIAYGKPNVSLVIAGTLDDPKEMLLFYDHGANKSAPSIDAGQQASATVLPIALEDLPNTVCTGPTILNIVAHQDDDLLFINPDTQSDITADHCVRTIYLTAGDAGGNQFYWLGREQGSESAYSKMIGIDNIWIQRIVKLAGNQYMTVANPKGNTKISLIFLRLPDGNIHGDGFSASQHEGLQNLLDNKISSISAIYGESTFTAEQLSSALSAIMHTYQPAEIRTQSEYANTKLHDHSDHIATAKFADWAYRKYEKEQFNDSVTITLKHYMGYPISKLPENVSGLSLEDKTNIFFAYAAHDGAVCHSMNECHHSVYGLYLPRQYAN